MNNTKLKRRSLVAKEVRTPKYRQRVVTSKKVYNRKRNSFCYE
jgi:hypothetical protein